MYQLEACGKSYARKITLDSVCVAMVFQETTRSWGLYSTSSKQISNVKFKTPDEAKVFYESRLKDVCMMTETLSIPDCHIIAAEPYLYDALQRLVNVVSEIAPDIQDADIFTDARAALSKARGE